LAEKTRKLHEEATQTLSALFCQNALPPFVQRTIADIQNFHGAEDIMSGQYERNPAISGNLRVGVILPQEQVKTEADWFPALIVGEDFEQPVQGISEEERKFLISSLNGAFQYSFYGRHSGSITECHPVEKKVVKKQSRRSRRSTKVETAPEEVCQRVSSPCYTEFTIRLEDGFYELD